LAGKSVVTSNKELVALKGQELLSIAKEKNVNYLFEASVGGGIPIIRPITQCLAANKIDEIYGILNGTTNYILTEMIEKGTSFDDALKEAQQNGFAEQNPAADIEGVDACRKICILSDLCYGRHVDPSGVSVEGIKGVSLADVEYARNKGYKIKLLGRAMRTGDDTITAYVAPHLISNANLLSNVDGVMNGIVVHGNAIGKAMFYGAGAGKRPTASAVIADVIDAAKHLNARKYLFWDAQYSGYLTDSKALRSQWYIRTGSPEDKIKKTIPDAQFINIQEPDENESAFITKPMSKSELDDLAAGIDILSQFRVLE
jgi:homoserine dehydrogenase